MVAMWLGWALAWPAFAQQPVVVPALSARVTDLTGTLDAAQRQRLDAQLGDIERRKGTQVAILIVPSTQPETIEEFGIRVADAWKLGRGRERAQRDTGNSRATAIDDGLLLLVAKNDRRVRIEVGYGLEGAIPDAVAKRIIGEAITPRFRTGDFAGGLEAAVADVSRRLEGEDLPPGCCRWCSARSSWACSSRRSPVASSGPRWAAGGQGSARRRRSPPPGWVRPSVSAWGCWCC